MTGTIAPVAIDTMRPNPLGHVLALLRRRRMPQLRFESVGVIPQDRPRTRLAAFLELQYRGDFKWKRLARDIEVTEKAAENLFAGHWPSNDLVLAALYRRFGTSFTDEVFGPEIDAEAARIRAEARKHLTALEALQQRERQISGDIDPASVRAAWSAASRRAGHGLAG